MTLYCTNCGKAALKSDDQDTILQGVILCRRCAETAPDEAFTAVFAQKKPTKIVRESPKLATIDLLGLISSKLRPPCDIPESERPTVAWQILTERNTWEEKVVAEINRLNEAGEALSRFGGSINRPNGPAITVLESCDRLRGLLIEYEQREMR